MQQKQQGKFLVSSVQGVITDCQVQNRFPKFHSGDISLRNGLKPECSSNLDKDALRELV